MGQRDDLLQLDGIGRNLLERRILALVDLVYSMETRLQGRADSSARTVAEHHDPEAREAASARECAYRTALADLYELLASLP